MQTVLELATEIQKETDRETQNLYCRECDTDTEKIRVYPYELKPLGYHGEICARVCLVCGNF
ncbi:MAG: hypothetical protein OXL96_13965 [Candidatus Poribacteria bacterium]|nr:hypothetical protein [Candidatus Poribacteria bacterium]